MVGEREEGYFMEVRDWAAEDGDWMERIRGRQRQAAQCGVKQQADETSRLAKDRLHVFRSIFRSIPFEDLIDSYIYYICRVVSGRGFISYAYGILLFPSHFFFFFLPTAPSSTLTTTTDNMLNCRD